MQDIITTVACSYSSSHSYNKCILIALHPLPVKLKTGHK